MLNFLYEKRDEVVRTINDVEKSRNDIELLMLMGENLGRMKANGEKWDERLKKM